MHLARFPRAASRGLLFTLALTLSGFGCGRGSSTDGPASLSHGPVVGAVGPDSAELWYRTNRAADVELRVVTAGQDPDASTPEDTGVTEASEDFTRQVRVEGLSPSTTYEYTLRIGEQSYGPFRFQTAPPANAAASFRVAFGSCTDRDQQPIFERILAAQPDLFLFVGDNHYGNVESGDLEELRQEYRWAHSREMALACSPARTGTGRMIL